MDAPTKSKLTQYARRFFSGTLLSRVSGMVRDVSMAAVFGDHPSVAAFMVAFRFSHFLRRLLGEGALQSIFIPHYEELRLKEGTKAKAFFSRLTMLLAALLIVIILVVEGGAHWIGGSNEVLHLFAWMFPSLFFICLYGLNISLLQCQNAFFLSSVAPFICNLIWIAAVFMFAKQEITAAMWGLSICIVMGFIIQWLMTFVKVFPTFVQGMKSLDGPLWSIPPEVKSISRATLFGLIGVMAVQLNSFLDLLFARVVDLKGPVYLWYAIRLQQLPLALIGFACVYSIIPSLSRLIKSDSKEEAHSLYRFGSRRIYQWMIPCVFATGALGFASINLLFGRGHFSQYAVLETTWCLWAYAVGLLPATLTVYQASLFYAYGDFKMPMWASLISVLTSTILNTLFVFAWHWGAISIAVSTSLSAWINYEILKKSFDAKKYWPAITGKRTGYGGFVLAGILAMLGTLSLDYVFFDAFFYQTDRFVAPSHLIDQGGYLLGQLLVFAAIFTGILYATGFKKTQALEGAK